MEQGWSARLQKRDMWYLRVVCQCSWSCSSNVVTPSSDALRGAFSTCRREHFPSSNGGSSGVHAPLGYLLPPLPVNLR